MDHDHSHHGGMDMGDGGAMQCNMNMLFTWNTENLCIVFSSWRVTGTWSLIWSLVAVMALTAGYEAVREASRRYESRQPTSLTNTHIDAYTFGANQDDSAERSSLLRSETSLGAPVSKQSGRVVRAAFYGVQVFYSFFIMLLFMTYNGWIMLAVGFGAFAGYLLFGNASATKSAACH